MYKRRAQLTAARAGRIKALKQSAEAYGKAFKLSTRGGMPGDTYPLLNQIATEIIVGWLEQGKTAKKPAPKKAGAPSKDASTETDGSVPDLLKTLDQLSTARAGAYTDTYNLLARAEYTLLDALYRRTLSDTERLAVEVAYGDALSRGVTSRQEEAVRAQLGLYRRAAKEGLPDAVAKPLIDGLIKLETAVLPRTS